MKKYLYLVLFLFLITRFYRIEQIPASVYWDEASIGYNAYSVLATGKDEWGKLFPIHFRAFGEFKLPVYIYSVVVSVAIFGLNSFAVRFPSVIFSLFSVYIVYLLSKKIFQNQVIGIMSSFLFSISPWFFIFSRTGYEATAGLMFYLLGIYLYLLSSKRTLFLAAVSMICSFYSYNSFRLIIILTLPLLVLLPGNPIKYIRKNIIFSVLLLTVIVISLIPTYRLYVFDNGASRLSAIGGLVGTKRFIANYLSHFSPSFLIFNGDLNLRSQQGFGQTFFAELLFFIVGFFFMFKKISKSKTLLIWMFLISFIPASITKESPHALRSILAAPLISMIASAGIFLIYSYIKNRIFLIITIILFLISFCGYYYNFINNYPIISSKDWQYGYKEIMNKYSDKFDNYEHILVSDDYAQPYIFFLYYLKFNPMVFRTIVSYNLVNDWGFSTVERFGKFKFIKEKAIVIDELDNNTLLFKTKPFNEKIQLVDTVNFLDGKPAFYVYHK